MNVRVTGDAIKDDFGNTMTTQSQYPNLKRHFEKFISSFNSSEFSKYEIRLINLLLAHFDEIVPLSTTGGNKRARKINELIQNNADKYADILPQLSAKSENEIFPIKELSSLEVKNFRGFSSKEEINFGKQYTLVYGPNGTGKSSFCEALEYSLLGSVEDASKKRIEQKKYLTNIVSGEFNAPILKAVDNSNAIISVTPSFNDYYFCFIEKNRIDSFARITSYSQKEQESLLALLFGLEEFNEFIDGFTENIESYIDTKGTKAEELKSKKIAIIRDIQITDEYNKKLANIEKEKVEIVSASKLGNEFNSLDVFINGDGESEGRLNEIEKELLNISAPKIEIIKLNEIKSALTTIEGVLRKFEETDSLYKSQKDKVVFRDLYQAVKELEKIAPDKCPVCETKINGGWLSIRRAKKNPYINAKEQLGKLENIAKIEKDRNQRAQEIRSAYNRLISELVNRNKVAEKIDSKSVLSLEEIELEFDLTQNEGDINKFKRLSDLIETNQQLLLVLDNRVNEKNEYSDKIEAKRNLLINEKANLAQLNGLIREIKSKEKLYKDEIEPINKRIEDFNKENTQLIQEVDEENNQISLNIEFVAAYKTLLGKLEEYNRDLPLTWIQGLNEITKDLYNSINRIDQPFELIHKLDFPTTPNQSIKVYFKDKPELGLNVLQIMSEGHIRCLGLSILLAKAIAENRNVLILDDIVNAIDDDHRGGIREVLFTNEKLINKQFIITSHAEQFVKDLDNSFPAKEFDSKINRVTMTVPVNRKLQMVLTNMNYLKKAKDFYDKGEKKDCLNQCRRALENNCNHLWNKLSKEYQIALVVQLRSPKVPPDLMSIVQSLRSRLKEIDPYSFNKVISLFEYFEGLKTKYHNVWNYLNRGVHEEVDQAEFDVLIVKEILEKLIELDSEIKK